MAACVCWMKWCSAVPVYLLNSVNPYRLEGQKTVAVELMERFDWQPPDHIIVPGGNLGNSSAIGKALLEMKQLGLITKLPKLSVIQAEGANALVRTMREDRPVLDPNRPGPSLSQLTVMETMHPGVVSCPSATPLRVVARMLAAHRIHAVIVFAEHRAAEPSEWSVVSDIDIVHSASLGDVESATAGATAATPVVIVSPGDSLDPPQG